MPAPIQKPHKPSKFLDTKLLIASLSIAVTIGLGSLFSNEALRQQKATADPSVTPPPAPPPGEEKGFAPLPTLVPLVNPAPVQASAAQPVGQNAGAAAPLRAVTAPTQVIVQKVRPVFDQPEQIIASGGGGGGSRGVTATRPSK